MKSKRIKFSNALAIAVATLCLLSVTSLWAQSGKNFYEGKTITFFAGSSAGGGTDLTARLIAKHLERYIPGKPAVLVVNKPGAGGMIAVNELYNVKKPDGLTMAISIDNTHRSNLCLSSFGDCLLNFARKQL